MKKKIKKPSKSIVFLMAALVAVMSSVPVYAAANVIVDKYDESAWSEEYSEQITLEEREGYVEYTAYLENDEVTEVYMNSGATLISNLIDIDSSFPATTRMIFGTQNMVAGDSVTFRLTAANSSDTFQVGIRNNDTYKYRWIEVTGSVLYDFAIDENASYSAYIYNPNSAAINLEGYILYYN